MAGGEDEAPTKPGASGCSPPAEVEKLPEAEKAVFIPPPELPLELALAWIYTRDYEFVSYIHRDGYSPLAEAFKSFSERRNKQYEPVIDSIEESWELVRDKIASAAVQLRGRKFLRSTVRSHGFEPYGIPLPIPASDIGILVLNEERRRLELNLPDWGPQHITGWTDVELWDYDLLAAFPAVTRTIKTSQEKLTRKFQMIKDAIDSLWPEGGMAQAAQKDQIGQIKAWIKENRKTSSGVSETADDRTVRRYLEKYPAN